MKRGLTVLAVASLVLAGVASASVQQGDTEVSLNAGIVSDNGAGTNGNSTDIYGEIGLGYFLTDNFQAGVLAGVGWWDDEPAGSSDGGSETTYYRFGVSGKYHFMPTNQCVPYIGARIGYGWDKTDYDGTNAGDGTDEGIWYGPLAGLRFELNENNDFFAEYQFTLYAGDYDDSWDETHAVYLGIIHQFK
ncbi:MAG: porin family protein [Phycisphaerae bacterium]|nr:porin family protein [Phycisphaerae bacterium]